MSSSVGVVVYVDSTVEAVAASLGAHAAAIDEVERGGAEVPVLLLDASLDPATPQLLAQVGGALVHRFEGAVGVDTGWHVGLRALESELIYLATTLAAPEPRALALLRDALADPAVDVALPQSGAPHAVMVRRSAVERLGGLAEVMGGGCPNAVWVIDALAHAIRQAGGNVVVVPDARVGGVPVRQRDLVLRPGWTAARLHLANPDAVTIGPHSYLGGQGTKLTTYFPTERIRIGSYCSIADEVHFVHSEQRHERVTDHNGVELEVRMRGVHRPSAATTFPFEQRFPHLSADRPQPGWTSKALVVGSDVWIGNRATILGAVTIGHGAVVGAGAMVAKDVPPYAIVVGNPARVIRFRYSPEVVDAMLEVAWWDWPEDKVIAHAGLLAGPVEEFLRAVA